MLAWIHLSAIFVEGPERVPEQARRIVLFLKRYQALPVLAKGGGYASGDLVPSKELHVVPLHMRTLLICVMGRKLTEGKAPPHATGLIVSRSHCDTQERKGKGMS